MSSSRKRSRDDNNDEGETGRHASAKKQAVGGAGGGAAAGGAMPKPTLSAAERARLARQSLAAQEQTSAWNAQPTATRTVAPHVATLAGAPAAASSSSPVAAASSSSPTKKGGAKAGTHLSAAERLRLAQQSLDMEKNPGTRKGGPGLVASSPGRNGGGGVAAAAGAVARPTAPAPAATKTASQPYRPPPNASPVAAKTTPNVTGIDVPTRAAVAPPRATTTAATSPTRLSSHQPPVATVNVNIQRLSVAPAPVPVPAPAPSVHNEEHLKDDGADVFHVEAPKIVGSVLRWIVYLALGVAAVSLLQSALQVPLIIPSNLSVDFAKISTAIGSVLWDRRLPCFDNSFASDSPAVPVADHCTQPDTEFLPCPPHSICEAGKVSSCENSLWVLHTPKSSPVASSCVPSSQGLESISRVTKLLEAWSWPSTCEGRPDAPDAPKMRQGADNRIMFTHGDVLAALQDVELLSHVEAREIGDLARGKLSVLWDKDESGDAVLWLGLLPGHVDHLPASCRAANVIVATAGCVSNIAYGAVKVGVLKPSYSLVTFVVEVLRVIYRTYPLGSSVILIWTIAAALIWSSVSRRRAERDAFQADVNLALEAAIEVLKQEREPLRCLALRDDLREQLDGQLQGDQFNSGVWPEVKSVLEKDQRISLVLVRGEESFHWVGPKSQ